MLRHISRSLGLLGAGVATLFSPFLSGCGSTGASFTCSITSPLQATTSAQSDFTLKPASTEITMYPTETLTLPVTLQATSSNKSANTVTISATSFPAGLTIAPVTGTVGSTVNLQLVAENNLATTCFTSQQNVFTAEVPVTLTATDANGQSTTQIAINVDLENPAFVPATTNLPVLQITTDQGAAIDSEDDYVTGTMSITDASDSSNNYSGTISIKGHGNSTWAMPKKPYRVKLDSKSGLMGMKSSKNWILLANYDDKSMLRNDLADEVSNIFDMYWTPSTSFTELYLNGVYEGVYQLSEKVEIDKNRLNITEMDDTDVSGASLTGGYLGEINSYMDSTFNMYTSPGGLPISLDDPDPPATEQSTYFETQLNAATTALYSSSFTNTTAGWRAHYDETSMAKWFLIEEFMGNNDAADWSSLYFYKPYEDPLFYMGPIWDMDVTSGNSVSAIANPSVPWVSVKAAWYVQLLKDPAFVATVKAEWTAKHAQITQLASYLDTRSTALSLGAQNNYQRWPTLGEKVYPNAVAKGSYTGEVDYLKSWITQRIAYMDAHYLQ